MKYIFLFCFLAISNIAFTQSIALKTKSFSVSFKLKNMGLPVKGSFKTGSAVIKYDEKNPKASSFVGIVVVNSINTGIGLRDKHLLEKDEYFQPKNFPELRMESKGIADVNGKQMVTFNLTMKGITKSITVPVTAVVTKDGSIAFNTTFSINRLDWQVGGKSMAMGDKIDITVNALAGK